TVTLTDYEPNHLTYSSSNSNAGVLVFSEMYYKNGWNAYIDGQLKDHFKVNYVLRALKVAEGQHTIEFKFEPKVIETGSRITLASSIILGLVIFGGIGFTLWRPKKREE
ncbi:MAG: YfhO family protein, partial [Maribacter sp.]|nr:YfhO family protein [Maribacter sp.]